MTFIIIRMYLLTLIGRLDFQMSNMYSYFKKNLKPNLYFLFLGSGLSLRPYPMTNSLDFCAPTTLASWASQKNISTNLCQVS